MKGDPGPALPVPPPPPQGPALVGKVDMGPSSCGERGEGEVRGHGLASARNQLHKQNGGGREAPGGKGSAVPRPQCWLPSLSPLLLHHCPHQLASLPPVPSVEPHRLLPRVRCPGSPGQGETRLRVQ